MPDLTFIVQGAPQAKGRHRSRIVQPKSGAKSFVMHYTDSKTVSYENSVGIQAKAAMRGMAPLDGPLHVEMQFWIQPPVSWPAWKIEAALKNFIAPDKKPDCSNIVKAVEDGMNGIVYHDDDQITGLSVVKRYSQSPRVAVLIFKSPRVSSKITRKDQLPHAP